MFSGFTQAIVPVNFFCKDFWIELNSWRNSRFISTAIKARISFSMIMIIRRTAEKNKDFPREMFLTFAVIAGCNF